MRLRDGSATSPAPHSVKPSSARWASRQGFTARNRLAPSSNLCAVKRRRVSWYNGDIATASRNQPLFHQQHQVTEMGSKANRLWRQFGERVDEAEKISLDEGNSR